MKKCNRAHFWDIVRLIYIIPFNLFVLGIFFSIECVIFLTGSIASLFHNLKVATINDFIYKRKGKFRFFEVEQLMELISIKKQPEIIAKQEKKREKRKREKR